MKNNSQIIIKQNMVQVHHTLTPTHTNPHIKRDIWTDREVKTPLQTHGMWASFYKLCEHCIFIRRVRNTQRQTDTLIGNLYTPTASCM